MWGKKEMQLYLDSEEKSVVLRCLVDMKNKPDTVMPKPIASLWSVFGLEFLVLPDIIFSTVD
jgi:hypothetical protein